ncbi:hypothetical protein B4098_2460 [Heyndrickxia coagulans]|uniref:Uncharacterized protein n=1 Tax=Heyndrickxia coagulans TaxID=1398 RepID=A0A150JNU6_HEYCO|nr:hypothetical protein B4098_2460 [Heyndrickxia coagulans]
MQKTVGHHSPAVFHCIGTGPDNHRFSRTHNANTLLNGTHRRKPDLPFLSKAVLAEWDRPLFTMPAQGA